LLGPSRRLPLAATPLVPDRGGGSSWGKRRRRVVMGTPSREGNKKGKTWSTSWGSASRDASQHANGKIKDEVANTITDTKFFSKHIRGGGANEREGRTHLSSPSLRLRKEELGKMEGCECCLVQLERWPRPIRSPLSAKTKEKKEYRMEMGNGHAPGTVSTEELWRNGGSCNRGVGVAANAHHTGESGSLLIIRERGNCRKKRREGSVRRRKKDKGSRPTRRSRQDG